MDEFIDELLREDRVCDTIIPRITKHYVLEEKCELQPREDLLDEEDDDDDTNSDRLKIAWDAILPTSQQSIKWIATSQ
ncbi:hypothetical protein C2G38_2224841 [Gigaspora rosea]|uniref:Pre-mRNA-splicing factor 38 n=1 Tax=Gigaspora rosea TaxID=44941 RepID=A0A397U434_9GLOM|nr:hypothetical protein C2G38_2224841 [Gigaspora rosea]